MTISLPNDLESSLLAAVQGGRFASLDEAVTEAARLLVRELKNESAQTPVDAAGPTDPLMGLWHDYADEMDEVVAEAFRQRRTDTWRETQVE